MNCEQTRDAFPERLDGPLPAVDEHLAECPTCAEEWDEYCALRNELRALALEKPLDRLQKQVLSRLEDRGLFERRPGLLDLFLLWFRRALLGGTALCYLLVLGWLGWLWSSQQDGPSRSLSPQQARVWVDLPGAEPEWDPGAVSRRKIELGQDEIGGDS